MGLAQRLPAAGGHVRELVERVGDVGQLGHLVRVQLEEPARQPVGRGLVADHGVGVVDRLAGQGDGAAVADLAVVGRAGGALEAELEAELAQARLAGGGHRVAERAELDQQVLLQFGRDHGDGHEMNAPST